MEHQQQVSQHAVCVESKNIFKGFSHKSKTNGTKQTEASELILTKTEI